MSTKNASPHSRPLSFIELARRKQIVAYAVDIIAERGYANASLGEIAKRAGISKGVISYHFASKEDLMRQVATDVLQSFADFVRPLVDVETTAAGVLRAFLLANAAFIQGHTNQLMALLDIGMNARDHDGESLLLSSAEADLQNLQALLQEGQDSGEFREFDTYVMAASILALRDSMLRQRAANPELDLPHYARELATMVELATRHVDR